MNRFNRIFCALIMFCILGLSQAAEPVFQDDVLTRTLVKSITDFIRDTEKDTDIKTHPDQSAPFYLLCAEGVNPKIELFPDDHLFMLHYQSNRNSPGIAKRYMKYYKKGVYVIFPYQVLSEDKITITIALRKLVLGTDNSSMTEQTIRISQYIYTLSEHDLSWHLTQMINTLPLH